MTETIKTRTKAPFAIVRIPEPGRPATLIGYAYTVEAARTRVRRLGFRARYLPVVEGRVEVER